MKDDIKSKARRRFLANMAAAGAAIPLMRVGFAGAAGLPHLDPKSAEAEKMHYTDDFKTTTDKMHKPGAHCGDCMLYQGGTAQYGACPVFPGHDVHIDGWCQAWTAKP
ncbi:MAG TPA: high-potential iron-sulfur protein [Nevskiaceae bacterium]